MTGIESCVFSSSLTKSVLKSCSVEDAQVRLIQEVDYYTWITLVCDLLSVIKLLSHTIGNSRVWETFFFIETGNECLSVQPHKNTRYRHIYKFLRSFFWQWLMSLMQIWIYSPQWHFYHYQYLQCSAFARPDDDLRTRFLAKQSHNDSVPSIQCSF